MSIVKGQVASGRLRAPWTMLLIACDAKSGSLDHLITNPSKRKGSTNIERRATWLLARIDEKRTEA